MDDRDNNPNADMLSNVGEPITEKSAEDIKSGSKAKEESKANSNENYKIVRNSHYNSIKHPNMEMSDNASHLDVIK